MSRILVLTSVVLLVLKVVGYGQAGDCPWPVVAAPGVIGIALSWVGQTLGARILFKLLSEMKK